MEVFDAKFKQNKARYALQCALATVAVLAVLVILDAISNAAVIAALGASSFIAFTMPEARVSRSRFLIGGYIAGVAAGALCHGLSCLALEMMPLSDRLSDVIFGAMAVGLAIFVMVVTNTEHPPAASLSLGLVLDDCKLMTVAVVLVGIVTLCVIKRALKSVLKNLL